VGQSVLRLRDQQYLLMVVTDSERLTYIQILADQFKIILVAIRQLKECSFKIVSAEDI